MIILAEIYHIALDGTRTLHRQFHFNLDKPDQASRAGRTFNQALRDGYAVVTVSKHTATTV